MLGDFFVILKPLERGKKLPNRERARELEI